MSATTTARITSLIQTQLPPGETLCYPHRERRAWDGFQTLRGNLCNSLTRRFILFGRPEVTGRQSELH
jgi:hypothetical protein